MISASLVKELREKSGAGMLDCKKALEAVNGNMEEAIDWLRKKGIAKADSKADRIAAEGITAIKTEGNDAVIIEVNAETDFVAKNEEFKELVEEILNAIMKSNVKTMEEAMQLETKEGTIEQYIIAKTAKIGEKLSFRRFEKVTKKDSETFGSYLHMGGKIAVLTVIEGAGEEVAKDVSMHAAAMRPKYIKREDVPAEEVEKEKAVLKEQAMGEGKPADIAEKMVQGRVNKFYKEICLLEQPFVKDGDTTVEAYLQKNHATIQTMIRYEVGEGIEKRKENFAEEVMNQVNG